MKKLDVSLDTNVIIHFYSAKLQKLIFSFFDHIYIDEFIFNVELINHGQSILQLVIDDVNIGKILVVSYSYLKSHKMYELYNQYFEDQKYLYDVKDTGEMRAIALAKVLNCMILFTDDIKNGGPYKTLLVSSDEEIIPLQFFEFLFLNYTNGTLSLTKFIESFNLINDANQLN